MRVTTKARDPYTARRVPRFAVQPEHGGVTRRRPLTEDEARLVEEHYHLVAEVVGRVHYKFPFSFSVDERQSAGALGLMDAARTWRPGGGAGFKGHAKRRILGAILDDARRVDWAPRAARREAKARGEEPQRMVSLTRDVGEGTHREGYHGQGGVAVDPRPLCAVERERVEAADEVRAALDRAQLEDRERALLGLRAEGLSLRAAGQALGVSESRACQLERRALDSVRWWHGLGDDETTHARLGRGAS